MKFLIPFIIALTLSSCASINHVREAQSAFSDAASVDNSARFEPGFAEQSLAASAGYAAAIVSVENLEGDSKALQQARDDQLYGVALAIKSMSHWRLDNWQQAMDASTQALEEPLGSRDQALMKAMPGLIKNDQAYAQLSTRTFSCDGFDNSMPAKLECSDANFDGVIEQLTGAFTDLNQARESAPANHPVRGYLAFSALATWENLANACGRVEVNDVFLTNTQAASCRQTYSNLHSDKVLQQSLLTDLCPGAGSETVLKLIRQMTLTAAEQDAVCPGLPRP
jgi:hypothetical protein